MLVPARIAPRRVRPRAPATWSLRSPPPIWVREAPNRRELALRLLDQTFGSADPYQLAHATEVARMAERLAIALRLDRATQDRVYCCGLLHDVGKVGIDRAVLNKPAKLDPREFGEIRRHSAVGAAIVAGVPDLAALAPLVRAVHERFDGGGYPDGLSGDQIPLESRLVTVCDAWHAMTKDRVYRRALARGSARAELRTNAGTQFDPAVVRMFLTIVDA